MSDHPDALHVGRDGRDDPRWRYDPSEPLEPGTCALSAHWLCRSGWCGCPCHAPKMIEGPK